MPLIFSYEYGGSVVEVSLSSCPSYPYSEQQKVEQIKSQTQDGYLFVRPRFTKERASYSLTFSYILQADKDKLTTMVSKVNTVQSFKYYPDFPESITGATYKDVILTDTPRFDQELKTEIDTYWSTNIEIEDI